MFWKDRRMVPTQLIMMTIVMRKMFKMFRIMDKVTMIVTMIITIYK